MDMQEIMFWRRLPTETQRLLSMAGHHAGTLSHATDQELLSIEGLGKKRLSTLRALYPFRPKYRTVGPGEDDKGDVSVHLNFGVNGKFDESDVEHLERTIDGVVQKANREKKLSSDNFKTKIRYEGVSTFDGLPTVVVESNENGVTKAMSDTSLNMISINKNKEMVDKEINKNHHSNLNVMPDSLQMDKPTGYGIFHEQRVDDLPKEVQKRKEYVEDKERVNRHAQIAKRIFENNGGEF